MFVETVEVMEPDVLDVMEFPLEKLWTFVECVEEMDPLAGLVVLSLIVELVTLLKNVCGVSTKIMEKVNVLKLLMKPPLALLD
jgi:hypothetical protein